MSLSSVASLRHTSPPRFRRALSSGETGQPAHPAQPAGRIAAIPETNGPKPSSPISRLRFVNCGRCCRRRFRPAHGRRHAAVLMFSQAGGGLRTNPQCVGSSGRARALAGEVPGFTPAASPRLRRRHSPWPPTPGCVDPDRSSPPVMRGGYAPRTSPYPPGLSWRCFKRRNDTGFPCIPSRLAHRARPVRQY